jgi:hypothetical protein
MAQKILNVALQGGGAHGAYTWGVLDRLSEEKYKRLNLHMIPAPDVACQLNASSNRRINQRLLNRHL